MLPVSNVNYGGARFKIMRLQPCVPGEATGFFRQHVNVSDIRVTDFDCGNVYFSKNVDAGNLFFIKTLVPFRVRLIGHAEKDIVGYYFRKQAQRILVKQL